MNTPIHKQNAIELMAFVIAFEQPFSPSTCEVFLGLQEPFSEEFPTFNRTMNVEIKVADEKPVEQSEHLNGIVMQKTRENGQPEWQLRAQGNSIIATCFHYDRWKIESEKAVNHLLKIVSPVEQDNPVALVALQTVDRFMDKVETYHISGVLNPDSRFLTKQALESGGLWHVHQGWFEQSVQDQKCLNVLNLSTTETPDGISTIIDHNTQMIFNAGKSVAHLENELADIFEILHNKNKEVIRELLSDGQKEKIGL
ncbi:MAG: TIGR04255 family protein [Mariprofundales bacterium]|nr:TIGR04255 family protein [Mariprofundales bacterium]